ncbi:tyrosine-type recombinase/integrase [Cobetia marina]|uniref:tyrosine-type recombinase/integrase n=1 Tax=Cobetia marina TaxID=28258 RepID=UPI003A912E6D
MKRTAIKRRPLADSVLANLEPEQRIYRESYGVDRLYFVVLPSGTKRWEVRYKRPSDGKWAWVGAGSYPKVSAKRARAKALEVAAMVDEGIDPIHGEQQQQSISFREASKAWFEHKKVQGRAAKTLTGMQLWMKNDALPMLGDMPLTEVGRKECAQLQKQIEDRKAHNTAEKSRVWLKQIFDYSIASGWADSNPATNLVAIAAPTPVADRYPHLMESELPDFLAKLSLSTSSLHVRTAARVVMLTASRPGMVRMAEWQELDLEEAIWSVPAEKMKTRRPHRVPLSKQVVQLLKDLKPVTGRSRWVFPGQGEAPTISDMSINGCFKRIGYGRKMTGHGARHTAKTLLAEHGWSRDWTETQLAHKRPGLEGVYNQAEYLEERREMMQWYADYLDALEAGDGKVLKKLSRKTV